MKTVKDAAEADPGPDSVSDVVIGSRVPDQGLAPASPGSGRLSQILSWLANRIRAITGKTNWWDAPDTTSIVLVVVVAWVSGSFSTSAQSIVQQALLCLINAIIITLSAMGVYEAIA